MDTTYKLNMEGYKVLILGIHDRDHKFQAISFIITLHERHGVYEFALKSI
jgi:hypothetical protein